MEKNLENLDLNLLRLLKVVVETRNTSVTAEKLGISQTSVSRGMAKLRETFGDQLFIRKAHGVEPSELAEKLAEAAEHMLTPFTQVLEAYQDFCPKEYTGDISIACELTLLDVFGKGLYKSLERALPKAKFKLVYWQQDSLQGMLDRKVDYMVHYTMFPLPQDIYTHHLSDIAINLVARKDHPVLSKTSDWEAIKNLPLVKYASDSMVARYDIYDELFLDQGVEPNISLVSHSVPVMVDKLVNSDAIAFNSSYILMHDEQLACYPLPPIPERLKNISVSGGYLQSRRGYPLNQYLHQAVQDFFNSIVQPHN
ncbi:LysR family transcriptional regulator [Vibrio europaeus]|uniref:LysR family transcriptional regulator n=1 Tax=Vibrio europaeus TaxID=300876 RepID=UPI00233F661D|nr:LysR family transcriptional regulator [Vibrio europaeus]MDC5721782.1 LysR family transcriptional regulator [Vibrio europaeus]MDC5758172.1 LysR family transcriptional regulator [Vibrio europaeus]MDC5776449.1 LysR family transcriptional regulator [Vibrio europaeus]MDC5795692.1 LysR family transcriptional regulator [Vibrio europaeus]MDC5801635.1 LysR family transcriptional regulator [Vibrio europaeus]